MQQLKQTFFNAGVIPSTSKNSYIIPCPIHGETNGKSLSINFDLGKWKCFGKCKTGGNLSKLMTILGIGYIGLTTQHNYFQYPLSENKNELIEIWSQDALTNFNKRHIGGNIKYFSKRGLSENIVEANKLSYNEWNQRVYMPVFCNKSCFGYVSRTILNIDEILAKIAVDECYDNLAIRELSKQLVFIQDLNEKEVQENLNNPLIRYYNNLHKYKPFSRYLNSFNLPKDDIVYEPLSNDDSNPYYIVTEGIIDALLANQYGVNSFAVLGTGLNQNQVDYIVRKSKGNIILMFDNDVAGTGFTNEFCKLAKNFFYVANWNIFGRKVKDIGDLKGQDEWNQLLEKCYLRI